MGRPKDHGYAALTPADVEDARRGNPGGDLRSYAQARGLEFLDKSSPAGFTAALPGFPEYRFSVMRGLIAGGEFGVLFHQALEVPVIGRAPSIDGKLYAVVSKSPGRWWMPSLPNRTDIPVIGDFLNPPTDDSPAEAFDSQAVWIPSTTAAINVPEAALPLYLTRIDRRGHHAPFDFAGKRSLDDMGLRGWWLRTQDDVTDDLVRRLLTGPACEVFTRRADDPLFQMLILRGTLLVRRNGYLRDPQELDALAGDAAVIARAARAACLTVARPRPFADPLPPAPSASSNLEVTAGWSKGYTDLAARLGLTLEDPDEYHRAFPSLPVPGRAVAVMRGTIPGTQVTGRLVYHAERSLKAAERARGAVLLPAAPGAEPTPPGGTRYPESALVHQHADGVAALWSMRTAGFFREEQDELIDRAVALARECGLAAI